MGIAILVLLALGTLAMHGNAVSAESIKVGVVSPLTGDAGFWGQSTIEGAKLAEQDLKEQGIDVEFIFEDSQLNPSKALSGVQKLVNVDNVEAIYSEFAPAGVTTSSYIKDKDVIHIYDAALESILDETPNNYKSYVDYQTNCKEVAQYLKNQGIEKVGLLEMNLEFAELCRFGLEEVYDDVIVEKYNPGETDFRTMLAKIKDVEAIFNPAFPAEVQNSIIQKYQLGIDAYFITNSDAISKEFEEDLSQISEKVITFGFPEVDSEFLSRLDKGVPAPEASAVAYTHLTQLAKALDSCDNKDMVCIKSKLDNAIPTKEIGFKGFKDRSAVFDFNLKQWDDGKFVTLN